MLFFKEQNISEYFYYFSSQQTLMGVMWGVELSQVHTWVKTYVFVTNLLVIYLAEKNIFK